MESQSKLTLNPTMEAESKLHVLIFPYPAQGHLTSMLKLAELLSLSGLQVTFLNSDYNHHRLSRFSAAFSRLSQNPNFRFLSIPDGLPDDEPRTASRFKEMEHAIRTRSVSAFVDMLHGRDEREGWSPVRCVVVDGLMIWAIDAAQESGVPAIAFRTSSSCSYWAYYSIQRMIDIGEIPFPEAPDLDEPILGIPGMEGIVRRRDLPSIIRNATDINDLQMASTTTSNTNHARALIFNTMEFLESPILSLIRSQCPITYSLGPLHSLLRNVASPMSSISASIWEEDRSCISWLDSQPHKSVIYISFGSFTIVTSEQMIEFWHGIVNSGCRFLWVVRPGSVEGCQEKLMPVPPPELQVAVSERGYLVEWAPQEEVLAHEAVGCFLTHSGWNSTMESIMAGVPMICWPFFVDQLINSRYVEEVWKIGMDMKDTCERKVLETMVRVAIEGESAEGLRGRAQRMAETARECVEEGGSSYSNLLKLIELIKALSLENRKL